MNVLPWTSAPLSTAAAGTLDPCYSDCDKFGGVTGGWYGSEDDPITLNEAEDNNHIININIVEYSVITPSIYIKVTEY